MTLPPVTVIPCARASGRYLVFCGAMFYPECWSDFVDSAPTLPEAEAIAAEYHRGQPGHTNDDQAEYYWTEIVDTRP